MILGIIICTVLATLSRADSKTLRLQADCAGFHRGDVVLFKYKNEGIVCRRILSCFEVGVCRRGGSVW